MASELAALSARLGRDPRLVQGAGGNTSLKTGDRLLVKASGTCLADALADDIFVELSTRHVLERIANGREDFETIGSPRGLAPSIETSMHAILPDPVVLHVHSVNAISWAVRREGRALVAPRLAGLDWVWVDYARPGLPLTRAIQQARRGHPTATVMILANHGVVVTGTSLRDAHERLMDLEVRLAAPTLRVVNPTKNPLQATDAAAIGARLPGNSALHALAAPGMVDDEVLNGVLYPDHVVFLGEHIPRLTEAGAASPGGDVKCIVVAERGVLLFPAASRGSEAMLECLALLAPTLPPSAELVFLRRDEIASLTGWDAEKLRQQLMKAEDSGKGDHISV